MSLKHFGKFFICIGLDLSIFPKLQWRFHNLYSKHPFSSLFYLNDNVCESFYFSVPNQIVYKYPSLIIHLWCREWKVKQTWFDTWWPLWPAPTQRSCALGRCWREVPRGLWLRCKKNITELHIKPAICAADTSDGLSKYSLVGIERTGLSLIFEYNELQSHNNYTVSIGCTENHQPQ